MTNEETLRHLTGEQIETLIGHYEIELPKKPKVSRAEKEAAVLKFAQEKELDLSDLIEEDEDKTKAEESKESAGEQHAKKGEGVEPEEKPAETVKEKKTAKKAAKTAPTAPPADEPEDEEEETIEGDTVEVTFIENTKFGGNRYQKNDKVTVSKAAATSLIEQKLAVIANGKKVVYTVCEQCKRTIE